MTAKTYFNVFDNQMKFDRAEIDMVSTRIHRYYPKSLRSVILRIRFALIDLYRHAEGAMTYSANYEHVSGKRFSVKESFYSGRPGGSNDDCNLVISFDSPDNENRELYDSLEAHPTSKIITTRAAEGCAPGFLSELVEFTKEITEADKNTKRSLFGEFQVSDLCALIAEIVTRSREELFVLSYSFDFDNRWFTVTLAGRECKSHVVTFTASDAL